jgi:hypothetical protein
MSKTFKYALVLLVLGCSTTKTRVSGGAIAVAAQQETSLSLLAITVITASDNMTRLPGAAIYIVRAEGAAHVGTTDQFGRVVLERALWMNADEAFFGLMVCHPIFYCGILRDEEIQGRGETTIALATRVAR